MFGTITQHSYIFLTLFKFYDEHHNCQIKNAVMSAACAPNEVQDEVLLGAEARVSWVRDVNMGPTLRLFAEIA